MTQKLYVIMGNDFPAGAMDDEAAANDLCSARNERQLRDTHYLNRVRWAVHPFTLNEAEE